MFVSYVLIYLFIEFKGFIIRTSGTGNKARCYVAYYPNLW